MAPLSCCLWDRVMSHLWMSHESWCRCARQGGEMWMSHVTYEGVMSHISTRMKELYHTYESVISHIWMSHESCHRCTRQDETRMSHVTCMNEACHSYEWVVSHEWMNHESCHRCARQGDEMRMSHGNRWTISSLRTPTLWNSSKGMYIYWRLELLHAYTIIRRCYQLWDSMGSIHFHVYFHHRLLTYIYIQYVYIPYGLSTAGDAWNKNYRRFHGNPHHT